MSESEPNPDSELARRLDPRTNPDKLDRDAAWEEWQFLYRQLILGFIIKTINGRSIDPEDIYQDALAVAYKRVESGGYKFNRAMLSTFTISVARNLIAQAYRKNRRRAEWGDYMENSPPMFHQPDGDDEWSRMLDEAIQVLAPLRAQVIALIRMGYSTREIAEILVMSEDAVRQAKFRAINDLRRHFGTA